MLNGDGSAQYSTSYDSYDAVGNLLQYRLINQQGSAYTNTYVTALDRYEGYVERTVNASSTLLQPGSTTDSYDVNGNLIGVADSTQSANTRTLVNDAQGHVLYREQAGNQQYFVFAHGQQVGTTGMGIDTQAAPGSNGAPAFGEIDDFNIGYRAISARYPSASVGSYRVAAGDSLQSIAQAAYGDSSLWYTLAEANGLSSNADLKVGQTVVIPNKVAGIHNNGSTFTPYDPSKAVGSTTPNLPQPQAEGGGCGGLGTILTLVVAVVVTVYTAGAAASAAGASFADTMAAGATALTGGGAVAGGAVMSAETAIASSVVGGMAGSIASQVVGNALGVEHGFSWKQVGLSAVSAGISAGVAGEAGTLLGTAASSTAGVVARAAVGNALTQGVGVVTGLQHSFNWMSVAASAVGAGVGNAVAINVQGSAFANAFGSASRVAVGTLSGLAAGTATAVLQGGRVSMQQIATDAFGNALGDSIAHADWGGSQRESELTQFRRSEIAAMNADALANGDVALGSTFAGDTVMRRAMNPLLSSVTEFTPEMKTDGTRPVYDIGDPFEQDGTVAAAGEASRSSSNAKLTMVPRELYALRDPAVLADAQAMHRLYDIAIDNSRAWLPTNLSPEETSLTTGMAYHKVFGEDRTAIWFGLAPYATSKVGETYQELNSFGFADRADASIIRNGFVEGNRAIFTSMFTAEQFYQAGGTDAVRAMVNIDPRSFGANWNRDNREYSNALVQSFELRDQAKDAFQGGQEGAGEQLLGQSLKSSADFEQRVVLQQYYDTKYTANDWLGNPVTKTLRDAMQRMADLGPHAIAERMSTVTINGQSLSFTGNDVGNVNQRMPFVYSLAGNLMRTYSGGSSGDWLSGSQRIYQEQFGVLQKTYGVDMVFNVGRRLGF